MRLSWLTLLRKDWESRYSNQLMPEYNLCYYLTMMIQSLFKFVHPDNLLKVMTPEHAFTGAN